jgi:hypothetical protein
MVCLSTGPDSPSTDPECLISGAFFVVRKEVTFSESIDRPDDLFAAWPLARALGRSDPVSSEGRRFRISTKTVEKSSENTLFAGDFAQFSKN